MAADAPISDILCEAMEYLSKLGANLRTRSEKLKERKIRKDKLQSAHAVQQAVSKVLLICELSKKSLENVEKEVKKIQSRVDRSQVPLDAGSKEKNKIKYYYFPYETQRLKIASKISFKHYMSAKVYAKKMSLDMQNKYPVYYECKLYRQRKKLDELKARFDKIMNKNDEEMPKGIVNEKNLQCSKSINEHEQPENSVENRKVDENDENNDSSKINLGKESEVNDPSTSKVSLTNENVMNEDGKTAECINKLSESHVEDEHHVTESLKNNYKSPAKDEQEDTEKKDTKDEKKRRKSTYKHIRVISESSSDNENLKDVAPKNSEENNANLPSNESSDNKNKSPPSKRRKLIVSDDDSDCEVTDTLSVSNSNQEMDIKENCETTSTIQEPAAQSRPDIEKNPQPVNSDSQTTQESSETKSEDGSSRPMIKCVNISNLLKPEIVKETLKTNKQCSRQVPKDSMKLGKESSKKKNENKIHSKHSPVYEPVDKSEIILKKKMKEDEYWEQKRKEVHNFKPKKFLINVSKLPKFNDHFMSTHNIKRIICNNFVLYKLSDTNTQQENINVKNALLNDSDSDELRIVSQHSKEANNDIPNTNSDETVRCSSPEKNDSNSIPHQNSSLNNCIKTTENKSIEDSMCKENEKIKSSLLNDSDTDKNDNEQNTNNEKNNANSKTSQDFVENNCKLNDTISHTTQQEKCTESSPNKINMALLNSSDDSGKSSDKSNKVTKSKCGLSRKSVMQSMEAKILLLTYSSSSEDEDSQRNKQKGSSDKDFKQKKNFHKRRRKKTQVSSSESSASESPKKDHNVASSISDEDNKEGRDGNDKEVTNEDKDCQNDQVDENIDEQSDSSRSKMVRSKAKPGSSISHNSDTKDVNDKDVDRLTNLNSLNKQSRRHSTASDDDADEVTKSRTTKKSSKPFAMEEQILKAECSSDLASADESIGAQEEYPPPMPIDLNNGLDHMAKDDLLGESDSSVSQNESEKNSEGARNVDESEEENMKLKRRKAKAISSDSEAGSSRKKDRETERLSDFEDSEDENSEPSKKSKRKKKGSDSDASGGSSDDGGKKKRRRIKQINDSDISDSDGETEGRNKHGRKNIRKVMGKNQLEEATKKAAREEKERIARIAERQKLYNNLEFDESGKPDEVVLEKVVLDFDPETKEPLIEVDRGLVKKLKPHQANGIKFMWDACFESVKRIKKDKGSGCILAHCMGLGKTLQVISLTHTLLTHGALTGVRRVLVVCPLSTVLNWVNEFNMWLTHAETDFHVDVYELSRHKQNSERAFQLGQWFECGGVCVLGYEMFRNLSADNNKKFKKKMLKNFQESLVDPGPDLVVCDEGHLLKNEKTSLSQSMNRVKTQRRIVLTGTPLQNNLKEYYCMVQFVKPNLLGKYNEYLNRFVNPITNGQYTDSTEHDIRVMKRRSHVLHKMLDGAVQRRDYGVLAPFLPPKHEYVLFITLSEVQIKLYQYYLDNYSRRPLPGKSSGFLFPDFQSLQRIWTHPLVLKYNSERYEIMQQKKREREEEEEDSEGSLRDFIDDDSTPEETSTEESSDDLSDMSDNSRKKSKKKKAAKKAKSKESRVTTRRGTRANPVELDSDSLEAVEVVEAKSENPTEWWMKLVGDDELDDMRNSHKLVLLFDILRQCDTIGDKLLVFSQSLYSLDLIEHFLGKVDEATQDGRIDEKLGGHVGSWSPGLDYFRLDGSTSCENRSIWCKSFNREDNPRARLFLISTRAGGLGINLVAANRVVIFDVSWNPSHDVQSIFRVYRFGQKKPCYVYRFLAMGTMEEKIYERQVTKQAISKRVIDEQQIDRHYAENDLAELYKFEPRAELPRELPPLPKDRLFAEMLREHENQIYKYHEHDSLLENKEEETLTEEERKAAWEDFENEKNKPPPAPFPTAWPMHNGMMPSLLAQQQQQMAYAALATMLRKDLPNINDNQIRDMLPLIFNSNPGMMQKMSEIYKYAQPGMMNPSMMNPAMNATGSGMGGSSGLQYEPPWQRQHQQQQQMRLQQLMQQQQNHMGAKYYAGGLGSRDPVAMALQQQRAREIMLGGGGGGGGGGAGAAGGRPRGRPPLQPRAPPAPLPHQDIVNLDSD